MFILSIIHSFFTFEPSLSPFFRLNVLWFRESSTERKASPFQQTTKMHPDHQPARLLAVTLPWAILCSFGISIKGYDTRSLPAGAPRRPLRIWRLRLFVFGEHCSHLDASEPAEAEGVGRSYCLSLAAGQAWQKCKVLGLPTELCFLSWLTSRVCCLALGGMRLSPGSSSAKCRYFFFPKKNSTFLIFQLLESSEARERGTAWDYIGLLFPS